MKKFILILKYVNFFLNKFSYARTVPQFFLVLLLRRWQRRGFWRSWFAGWVFLFLRWGRFSAHAQRISETSSWITINAVGRAVPFFRFFLGPWFFMILFTIRFCMFWIFYWFVLRGTTRRTVSWFGEFFFCCIRDFFLFFCFWMLVFICWFMFLTIVRLFWTITWVDWVWSTIWFFIFRVYDLFLRLTFCLLDCTVWYNFWRRCMSISPMFFSAGRCHIIVRTSSWPFKKKSTFGKLIKIFTRILKQTKMRKFNSFFIKINTKETF